MKYVVFYEGNPERRHLIPEVYPGHSARCHEFFDRGAMFMAGAFMDGGVPGAMSIFPTRADAESFIEGDPFVLQGVVSRYYIREWNEGLVADGAALPPKAQAS
jgi:uncharacterized protein YciI